MIHDTLLSCLDLGSKVLSISSLIETDVVFMFLHPSEKKILVEILNIVNLLRDIKKYASSISFLESHEQSYFNAFSCGLNDILQDYVADVTKLELEHFERSNHSILLIYEKLRCYESLALFFSSLIRKIPLENVQGCRMIQFLYNNFHHGDLRIYNAMKHIHKKIIIVFLKQLSNWVIYAKIVDKYDEFFIQNCKFSIDTSNETDKDSTCSSVESDIPAQQDEQDMDIWNYEIVYNLLPKCFSINWARNVLFIGQAILLFEMQKKKTKEFNVNNEVFNLWNNQEIKFLKKIQNLQNDNQINVLHFEKTFEEIKSYVMIRLSTIAINQAHLITQIQILKEYFLLARGELYLEFLRTILNTRLCNSYDILMADLIKIFESSANSVGATSLDQISIGISTKFHDSENNSNYFNVFNEIQLNYKINWPLQLLFSPKVMQRYNKIFRFLLRIKKIQYQLHLIWREQMQKAKTEKYRISNYMLLHNQLMFFIDNLQYYIQVEVLECQFNILNNSIQKDADFEKIQKAHVIFQANVMSSCFLFSTDDDEIDMDTLPTTSVLQIFLNLFDISETFCALMTRTTTTTTELSKEDNEEIFNKLKSRLVSTFDMILSLSGATHCKTPLAQFLLRLDFNHWFSSKRYHIN